MKFLIGLILFVSSFAHATIEYNDLTVKGILTVLTSHQNVIDDSSSVLSIDVTNRLLKTTGGVSALNWSSSTLQAAGLTLSGAITAGSEVLNGSVSGAVTLKAGTTVTNYTLTLPTAQGGSQTTLLNDGSGTLTWGTSSSASSTNLLLNPSFEIGPTTNWIVSGATATANTSNYHDLKQSVSLALSASGSMIQGVASGPTYTNGLMEASMWANTTVTTAKVCPVVNSTILTGNNCNLVPSTGVWTYVPVNFSGPLAGTSFGVALVWTSTSGTILADQAYVGQATNLFQVSQTPPNSYVGYYPLSSSNYWSNSNSSGTYTDFTPNGTIPSPTTIRNVSFGTPALPASSLPGITFVAPATGTIDVDFAVYAPANANTVQVGYILLESGSSSIIGRATATNSSQANSSTHITGLLDVVYGNTYTLILRSSNNGGATNYIGEYQGVSTPDSQMQITLKYNSPAQSQLAMTPNTSPGAATLQFSGTGVWSQTSIVTSYTDFAAVSGTETFSTLSNTNMGTCSAASSGLPGFSCDGFVIGRKYRICASAVGFVSGAGIYSFGLSDGTTTFSPNDFNEGTGTNSTLRPYTTVCGDYVAASTAPQIRLVSKNPSNFTIDIGNGPGGSQLTHTFTIEQLTGGIPSPILIGGVTSNSAGMIKLEGATVNNTNGSSSIIDSTSSWITTNSCASTGDCLYTTNGFSSSVYCTCTGNDVTSTVCTAYTPSSTSVHIRTLDLSGSQNANNTKVMCMGTR